MAKTTDKNRQNPHGPTVKLLDNLSLISRKGKSNTTLKSRKSHALLNICHCDLPGGVLVVVGNKENGCCDVLYGVIREIKIETFSGRRQPDWQSKPGTEAAVASRPVPELCMITN